MLEHPLRRECLNLLVVDSSRAQAWLAEIKRQANRPPQLGDWQGPGETGGPFIEAMRFAVGAQS